jgi:hypothetical protein
VQKAQEAFLEHDQPEILALPFQPAQGDDQFFVQKDLGLFSRDRNPFFHQNGQKAQLIQNGHH